MKNAPKWGVKIFLEARTGFEPVIKALQASALPLGHLAALCAHFLAQVLRGLHAARNIPHFASHVPWANIQKKASE